MKKTKRNNLASLVLGTAIMSTSAIAGMNGSCGAGKCGGNMDKSKCKTETCMDKKAMKKGSCGAGKCGANMKKGTKKASGSCGGSMSGNSGKKSSGSCGAGKCGSM